MSVIRPSNLVDVLLERAARTPDLLAFRFLEDGLDRESTLTYGELGAKARAIAAALQDRGARGERALLLYPPGTEYVAAFFGCLLAGAVAVPAYPPTPRTMPRLLAVLADSGARFGLTTGEIAGLVSALHPEHEGRLAWIATDTLDPGAASAYARPLLSPDDLALLQYTSGSTGSPKGVMLSHANLMRNEAIIAERFEHHLGSAGVNWLPPYHDMGLIGCILQPIYLGYPTTMMSPLAFVRHPIRWLQAITRYRATTAGGPNFGYELLCRDKVTPEQCEGLDLRSWDVAFIGAEPTRAETIERFAKKFAPYGFRREAFYHCYGLAESTLMVSGGRKAEAPIVRRFDGDALGRGASVPLAGGEPAGRALVSAGRVGLGEQVVIVDPETRRPCAPGAVGEIWVRGASVARGYWGRPGATAETFEARLEPGGEWPFLRTGDLGFVLDGELYVTGRIKDTIIVDGLKHYPQDIERTVEESHAGVRPGCGAAFAFDDGGRERVAIVYEIAPDVRDHDAVLKAIAGAVSAAHGVGVAAIRLVEKGTVPKTTSGKIQRRACRSAFLEGALAPVAAWPPQRASLSP
jgi:acyl-CoA synthetase (AMP-forming)/AMP-acid ligase II